MTSGYSMLSFHVLSLHSNSRHSRSRFHFDSIPLWHLVVAGRVVWCASTVERRGGWCCCVLAWRVPLVNHSTIKHSLYARENTVLGTYNQSIIKQRRARETQSAESFRAAQTTQRTNHRRHEQHTRRARRAAGRKEKVSTPNAAERSHGTHDDPLPCTCGCAVTPALRRPGTTARQGTPGPPLARHFSLAQSLHSTLRARAY